jgi:hypothetical protein
MAAGSTTIGGALATSVRVFNAGGVDKASQPTSATAATDAAADKA